MKSRWPIILIVLIAVSTPLLATALFYFAPPTNTTNRGELLNPPIKLPTDLVPALLPGEVSWHLLAFGNATCNLACQQRLCIIRQVRLVHVGDIERIGRLWLVTSAGDTPTRLTMEPGCGKGLPAAHIEIEPVDILTGVTIAQPTATVLTSLSAISQKSPTDYLYLVDGQNQIIMRYQASSSAQDIAKDLGRLLRLSRRG